MTGAASRLMEDTPSTLKYQFFQDSTLEVKEGKGRYLAGKVIDDVLK
jgi:hypothetical protein